MPRTPGARRAAPLAALGAAGAGAYVPALAPLYAPLAEATARAAAVLARACGVPVARSGTILVHAGGFACDLDATCAGTVPAAAVAIAVLVTRASPRRRAVGLVALTLLALALNLVRLTSLVAIGVHAPAAFGVAHGWIWPVLLMALLAAGWRAWRPEASPLRPPASVPDTTATTIAVSIAVAISLAHAAPAAASAGRPDALPPGDLIVRFADTSPAHAAVMENFENPQHADATAELATRLSGALLVPLRAVQVTSGRELVLSIDRARLVSQVAERVAQAPAFRGARATAVISAPAGRPPPKVLLPATLSLRIRAPPDSDAGRAVAEAQRDRARNRDRIAALARSLVPGHEGAVAARVDAQGRLLLDIDLRVLVEELVAALQKQADVVYAQANRMLRPAAAKPR